jgi:DNA helicase-2/ATP-dependent DNA helicase PcrA
LNPPEQHDFLPAIDGQGAPGHTLLDGLNEAQRQAVAHGSGPLLVLAGAGSGKTRVITHRIAWLISQAAVPPSRIVAVTFTNKAAAEMRERVATRLSTERLACWVGTFHGLCLRILRRDGERIGLQAGFNIYDTDDQLALVKRILRSEGADKSWGTPRSFLSRISWTKNALQSPDEAEKRAFTPDRKLQARIYRRYEEALHQANAVDFDDLLVRTLDLFNTHDDVAARYSSRCEHLLVDEYQDTNRPQYRLIRHLCREHGNVFVVGDEDQSIYRFRGAEIRNILDFEHRSTGTIIRATSSMIANNVYRKGKTLWTDNDDGEPIELFRAPDDRLEVSWVSRRVRELEGRFSYDRMAVLYRTNAQSRLLEEIFRRDRIPYQVVGAVQFYDRKEVKDVLAYLKLAANPADDVSFRRVVNTPARGIGATTLGSLENVARSLGLPLSRAAEHALGQDLLPPRAAGALRQFLDLVQEVRERADEHPVAPLIEHILEAVDYAAHLEKSFDAQAATRMENVASLVSAAVEYTEETGRNDLLGFLDRSALVADTDEVGREPGVTMMTVHCAKGLEFPVVFIVGLEENVFPHAMSMESDEDVEEERRLCYVAMTRAMNRLMLSHAHLRRFQGALLPNRPSRFLDEIPQVSVQEVETQAPGFFDSYDAGTAGGNYGGSSAARLASRRAGRTPAKPSPQRSSGPPPEDGFAVGALVLHPRFGGGTILNREGSGKNLKLTIRFSDCGPKKILPSYTSLKVQAD